MDKTQQALITQAIALFQGNEYGRTLALLENLRETSGPLYEKKQALKAAIAIRENRIDEGLQLIDDLENQVGASSEERINLKGIAYRAKGDLPKAIDELEKGVKQYPHSIDLLHNLAVTVTDLGRLDYAIEVSNKLLILRPNFLETLKNLGRIYITKRDSKNAKIIFDLIQNTGHGGVDVLVGLGAIELIENQPQRAAKYFEDALMINPRLGSAWANLGICHKFLGEYQKAEECLIKAHESDPKQVEHLWNLALVQLVQGKFAQGWKNYEVRFDPSRIATDRVVMPNTPVPRLSPGDDVRGKTIVLVQEQGFGDTFQFYRYAENLKKEGAKHIIAIVAKELSATVRSIPWIDEAHFEMKLDRGIPDYWVFPVSLSHRYEIGSTNPIPKNIPYIGIDRRKVEQWEVRLKELDPKKLRVGLVWAGRETHSNDKNRSLRLHQLERLAKFSDQVEFISLQKGERENDYADPSWKIHKLGSEVMDFSDSSGIFANLDLLISIDSAPVHLAGAMGMPVWTLIPKICDFRWLETATDSAWYPTMRLFRQKDLRGWDPVFQELEGALAALIKERPRRWNAWIHDAHPEILNKTTWAGFNYYLRNAFEYHKEGQFQKALSMYLEALKIEPNNVDVLRNLAVVYRAMGQVDKAKEIYLAGEQNAITDSNFYANYANLLLGSNQLDDALVRAMKATELDSKSIAAWTACYESNTALKRLPEAAQCLQTLFSLAPKPEYLFQEILLLLQLQEYAKALERTKLLLDLDPTSAEQWLLIAQVYQENEQYDASLKAYQKVGEINPHHPDLFFNRAVLKAKLHDYEGAVADSRQCIALMPNNAEAHFHLGCYLLALGQMTEGWREYEWRMDPRRTVANRVIKPNLTIPLWGGENLQGKTILIMPEQGYGDYIQFIRYTKWLKDLGATVIAASHPASLSIIKTCPWVDQVVGDGAVFKADYWVFAMSLPGLAKTKLESIPAPVPYLFANPEKVASWKKLLYPNAKKNKPLIGLCWSGSQNHIRNLQRSIPLEDLSPLFDIDGVDFIGIDRESTQESFPLKNGKTLRNIGPGIQDFSDTAAIIENLDLLITIDSAPAHLAGAMNKPCWILLDKMPDFRWLLNRTDSAWYPSISIYRKGQDEGWSPVITQVKEDLLRKVKGVKKS